MSVKDMQEESVGQCCATVLGRFQAHGVAKARSILFNQHELTQPLHNGYRICCNHFANCTLLRKGVGQPANDIGLWLEANVT